MKRMLMVLLMMAACGDVTGESRHEDVGNAGGEAYMIITSPQQGEFIPADSIIYDETDAAIAAYELRVELDTNIDVDGGVLVVQIDDDAPYYEHATQVSLYRYDEVGMHVLTIAYDGFEHVDDQSVEYCVESCR